MRGGEGRGAVGATGGEGPTPVASRRFDRRGHLLPLVLLLLILGTGATAILLVVTADQARSVHHGARMDAARRVAEGAVRAMGENADPTPPAPFTLVSGGRYPLATGLFAIELRVRGVFGRDTLFASAARLHRARDAEELAHLVAAAVEAPAVVVEEGAHLEGGAEECGSIHLPFRRTIEGPVGIGPFTAAELGSFPSLPVEPERPTAEGSESVVIRVLEEGEELPAGFRGTGLLLADGWITVPAGGRFRGTIRSGAGVRIRAGGEVVGAPCAVLEALRRGGRWEEPLPWGSWIESWRVPATFSGEEGRGVGSEGME